MLSRSPAGSPFERTGRTRLPCTPCVIRNERYSAARVGAQAHQHVHLARGEVVLGIEPLVADHLERGVGRTVAEEASVGKRLTETPRTWPRMRGHELRSRHVEQRPARAELEAVHELQPAPARGASQPPSVLAAAPRASVRSGEGADSRSAATAAG